MILNFQKAMGVLELGGRVELEDSRFLRAELNIHKEEHTKLIKDVSDIESKNLELLTYLFDCKVEDIRFSKYFGSLRLFFLINFISIFQEHFQFFIQGRRIFAR